MSNIYYAIVKKVEKVSNGKFKVYGFSVYYFTIIVTLVLYFIHCFYINKYRVF